MSQPVVGEAYIHFSGIVYKVVGMAVNTNDFKDMVIYQEVDKPEHVWVCSEEEFSSKVDKDKFPYAKQADVFAWMSMLERDDIVLYKVGKGSFAQGRIIDRMRKEKDAYLVRLYTGETVIAPLSKYGCTWTRSTMFPE
jgi:hypothetical protein